MFEQKILMPQQYYYPALRLLEDRADPVKRTEFLDALKHYQGKGVLLYIHFPFCDSHCQFCGFDKRYNLEGIAEYVQHLKDELSFYAQFGIKINNIHLGGGTPTLTPGPLLTDLISFIRENFDCAPDMNINIEGSCTCIYHDDIIQFIKDAGVTRASIGIQTFYQPMREIYQQKATLDEAYLTLDTLKKNDIPVFVDILFGGPDFDIGKTAHEITLDDIREAARLEVAGIDFSHYYPYANNLAGKIKKMGLKFPSTAKLTANMNECYDLMESMGYHQTTNYGFVRQGKIIMETSYYGGEDDVSDTLAIGCSAFGQLNGYKYRNPMYSGYMRRTIPSYMQIKKLTDTEMDLMNIVSFSKLLVLNKTLLNRSAYKEELEAKLRVLIAEGAVVEEPECYRLTRKGSLFVDNIYLFMLDENEKKNIDGEIKLITFD